MQRFLSCLLLTPALLLGLPGAAKARGCAGADVPATRTTAPVVREALECLHAQARAAHGLPPLRGDSHLTDAADSYSAAMVRGRFFSHVAPSGAGADDRVRLSGLPAAARVAVGENIGWGAGAAATARHMMDLWLASPGHRDNILGPRYRAIGVGVAPGSPSGPVPGAATFTVLFAGR